NGQIEPDIRNLDVEQTKEKDSRSRKNAARRYLEKGKKYTEYCKTNLSAIKTASFASALLATREKTLYGLEDLQRMSRILRESGKGTHKNYDYYVGTFNKYLEGVSIVASNIRNIDVDRETVDLLNKLCLIAIRNAKDYLSDKNMKLPRHKAAKEILDLLENHSSRYEKAKIKLEGMGENSVLSLRQVLDDPNRAFENPRI
ncbi:MAG: hypothetical protein K5989_07915, partial [Lachnospiraceae bacterium]|nr:hypothetical protein [Lachnospiraceae bacterium]